jgi:gluconolactonase
MVLYPFPENLTTTAFTRMPDKFRGKRPSAWGVANRGGAVVDSFLEGPSFDRQGNLYVTDIPFGRVFRIGMDQVYELEGRYLTPDLLERKNGSERRD